MRSFIPTYKTSLINVVLKLTYLKLPVWILQVLSPINVAVTYAFLVHFNWDQKSLFSQKKKKSIWTFMWNNISFMSERLHSQLLMFRIDSVIYSAAEQGTVVVNRVLTGLWMWKKSIWLNQCSLSEEWSVKLYVIAKSTIWLGIGCILFYLLNCRRTELKYCSVNNWFNILSYSDA